MLLLLIYETLLLDLRVLFELIAGRAAPFSTTADYRGPSACYLRRLSKRERRRRRRRPPVKSRNKKKRNKPSRRHGVRPLSIPPTTRPTVLEADRRRRGAVALPAVEPQRHAGKRRLQSVAK